MIRVVGSKVSSFELSYVLFQVVVRVSISPTSLSSSAELRHLGHTELLHCLPLLVVVFTWVCDMFYCFRETFKETSLRSSFRPLTLVVPLS